LQTLQFEVVIAVLFPRIQFWLIFWQGLPVEVTWIHLVLHRKHLQHNFSQIQARPNMLERLFF